MLMESSKLNQHLDSRYYRNKIITLPNSGFVTKVVTINWRGKK